MGNTYIGIDGIARKIKNMYVGVDGVARKVKNTYIGVDGTAKIGYQSGSPGDIYNYGKFGLTTGFHLGSLSRFLSGIGNSTFTLESNYISTNFNTNACLVTDLKIDFKEYTKLFVEFYTEKNLSRGRIKISSSEDKTNTDGSEYNTPKDADGKTVYMLDISNFVRDRSFYIWWRPPGIGYDADVNVYKNIAKLYRIWLE